MFARIPALLIALGALSLIFGLVEWRWPAIRGQKRIRQGFLTDVTWWLFTPTISKLFSGVFVAIVILTLARILHLPITIAHLKGLAQRDTAVSRQPIAVQLVEFMLLADFLSYWQHRAFHSFERLWRIHAVHHSSTQLDWLSAVRVHPLNEAFSNTAIAAPLILVGFSPMTVAAYLPFLTFYAIMLHANVSWDMGPLRYVISSPAFHRWHHSAEAEALDKNFAGLFPMFDWLFGTLYMPRDKRATVFGTVDRAVPSSFIKQLSYPLRKAPMQSREPASA
jgi:sterol desaturase/sphingolipid hydroxylase (fatty acid hydroxylase superfamily)